MNVKATYIYPPIPHRAYDWCAYDDDTYDGTGSLIGYGATEPEAIANFWEQYDERLAYEESRKIDAVMESRLREELRS